MESALVAVFLIGNAIGALAATLTLMTFKPKTYGTIVYDTDGSFYVELDAADSLQKIKESDKIIFRVRK